MALLQPGDTAPQFNLPDQNGVLVSIDSHIGRKKILIYFYPKAMTPGCTIQARKLRDNMDTFRKLGIEVIGVSNDKSEKLFKFSKKEMLNFTLLYDENFQISKKFGVWGEKNSMGKTYNGIHRVSFIIDQTGTIEQVFKSFKPIDHDRIVLRYLHDKHASPHR
ncbi:Putative peroxiredoxin bcp [Candidatus Blochmanniella chromaiodes str. 640]|uniref:thioredoxin-dependent peroxiredoxin n=1 Tax=Candidatus Blochmanniella chromaiodes str. 640 TaxID=1240471 RepID=A0ABN4AZN1_9ENTR|nr:thioredoxin-dependent thiol peroxidase [Candidatus Blochmannia chromaiodes]AGC03792.1 Putative peroxiredoxin bcp [Candidatus Blochmannia chromaiodes str. 640]